MTTYPNKVEVFSCVFDLRQWLKKDGAYFKIISTSTCLNYAGDLQILVIYQET